MSPHSGPWRSGAPCGPAAPGPGLPAATLLWRLPLSLPPGPRLPQAPAQGRQKFRGEPLPLCQHIPPAPSRPPSPSSAHKHPRCPGTPTSRTEPASCTPRTLLPRGPRTSPGRRFPLQSLRAATGGRLQTSSWAAAGGHWACPGRQHLWAPPSRSLLIGHRWGGQGTSRPWRRPRACPGLCQQSCPTAGSLRDGAPPPPFPPGVSLG